jgi:hypothetical protein
MPGENSNDPRDVLMRRKYFSLRPKPLERWLWAQRVPPARGARVLAALARGSAAPRLVLGNSTAASRTGVLPGPVHGDQVVSATGPAGLPAAD